MIVHMMWNFFHCHLHIVEGEGNFDKLITPKLINVKILTQLISLILFIIIGNFTDKSTNKYLVNCHIHQTFPPLNINAIW